MSRPFHSSTHFMEGISLETDKFPVAPPATSSPVSAKTRFGYLIPHIEVERLKTSFETVSNLIKLGATMREQSIKECQIPSVYTYFGQFIAHDITFDPVTKDQRLHEEIEPLQPEVVNSLPNRRSGLLDLDSVYGPGFDDVRTFDVPLVGEKKDQMKLGAAYRPLDRVAGTDLPRTYEPPHQALIGDPRNDENLPLSQLHLAFLRAHNRLIQANLSFSEARSLLRRRFQNLVVKDFLPRFVHKDDLAEAETKQDLYSPKEDDLFIPIEFTAAAFRFGHSMIRSHYAFNKDRGTVSLKFLFTPEAMGNYNQVLADWVIDWSNFVETGTNKARAFYPQLVEPLAKLIDKKGLQFSLAVNDLLRGYLLGLPTGQSLAKAMKVSPLSDTDVLESAISDEQKQVLKTSGFDKATPLWFYLFAEARKMRNGLFLGPVCGQMIALVLKELARRSNYEDDDPWNETLGEKADFNLSYFVMNTLP